MGAMRLVEAASLSPDELAAVESIYTGAFPDELQAPFAALFADRMLVLLDEDGPAGFALVRDLPETTWTFLRFYAVGRRGRGTGSLMWASLTALLEREGRTRLIWDVEDPAEPSISPEIAEEHRRRIVFYERLGGRLHPVREYFPPHDDGHAPPLLLMDAQLGAGDGASLRAVVEGVFQHRYGLAADHPAVRRTLLASSLI